MQPFDGVGIGPLQIVENEHERSGRSECLPERFEESQALPVFELQIGGRNIRTRRYQFWMKSSDVGQPGLVERPERRLQAVALQPRCDRRVGEPSLAGITTRGDGGDVLEPAPVDQFLSETALANTRFAANENQ